jgi:hypothetical protein
VRIARAGQPASAFRRKLVHVSAQSLDEERLGEFRQNRHAARTSHFEFAHRVTYRALNPRSRWRSTHVEFEGGRQAVQEQITSMSFASEIAANDAGLGSAAAPLLVSQFASREARREARRGKQSSAFPVRHLVGVAVRKNHDIPGRQRETVVALHVSAGLSVRHEMEENEMLTLRRQLRCERVLRGRCKAPGS